MRAELHSEILPPAHLWSLFRSRSRLPSHLPLGTAFSNPQILFVPDPLSDWFGILSSGIRHGMMIACRGLELNLLEPVSGLMRGMFLKHSSTWVSLETGNSLLKINTSPFSIPVRTLVARDSNRYGFSFPASVHSVLMGRKDFSRFQGGLAPVGRRIAGYRSIRHSHLISVQSSPSG